MLTFVCGALAVSLTDFLAWKDEHKVDYRSRTEEARRFRTFQENAARIENMRRNNPHATFALNRFADLSREEFGMKYNNFRANVSDVRRRATVADRLSPVNDPTSFDWRTKSGVIPPVQDQGQCGSCWAFSATCNMETRYAIKTGQPVNKLAEQALVDCDHECGQYRNFNACDQGCNGGLMPNAFVFAKKNGMPTEGSYPYTAADGTCKRFQSVAKFSSWEFVAQDEGQMQSYLVANSPIAIAVDASNWQFYQGGVMTGTDICPKQDPSNPSLDHGVTIVGYGTDNGQNYWLIRNSWADSWGESGYCRIAKGSDFCGVALFACSVLP